MEYQSAIVGAITVAYLWGGWPILTSSTYIAQAEGLILSVLVFLFWR